MSLREWECIGISSDHFLHDALDYLLRMYKDRPVTRRYITALLFVPGGATKPPTFLELQILFARIDDA